MDISVVIPTYNKARSIHETLVEVKNACDSFKLSYEVLVVDDHSTDKTYNEIVKTIKGWMSFNIYSR